MRGGGQKMKKKVLALMFLSLLLVGCGGNNNENNSNNNNNSNDSSDSQNNNDKYNNNPATADTDEKSTDPDYQYEATSVAEASSSSVASVDSIQNSTILHAWNWKMNDIKSKLTTIKNAGYNAIQISPMQPKVDGSSWADQSTQSQWWKLYQPVDFRVAESGENFLGTKSELTSLCTEAKKQGLKVVVDIVANHLATDRGQWKSSYPTHGWGDIDYNNGESIVKGDMGGLPDIDTSSSTAQNAVLSMLKSYVDCGISGFRFDAAKHIETPDDGSYSSQFWPTVLNGTTSYATSKGMDKPYYYGEVLNGNDAGRGYAMYTKMMSVCDNKQGSAITSGVNSQNSGEACNGNYNSGVDPSHLVLWAESHDTWANDSGYEITRDISKTNINKAYAIQTSRKNAATLYFARPSDNNRNVKICTIDENTGWKDNTVKAVNLFHQYYIGQNESISNDSNRFVNVRGSGNTAGAVIVDVNNGSGSGVNVSGLSNGTYKDLVTNKEVTVSNGKVNVTFTDGISVIVPKGYAGGASSTPASNANTGPTFKAYYNKTFKDSTTIKVEAPEGTTIKYSINNGSNTTLSGNTIKIPSSTKSGTVTVKIIGSNSSGEQVINLTLTKEKATNANLDNYSIVVLNVDSDKVYYAWVWSNENDGKWVKFTVEGEDIGVNIDAGKKYIIVEFPSGTTQANWDNKIFQTADLTFSNHKVWEYNNLPRK